MLLLVLSAKPWCRWRRNPSPVPSLTPPRTEPASRLRGSQPRTRTAAICWDDAQAALAALRRQRTDLARFQEREARAVGLGHREFHGAALFGSVNRIYDVRVSVLQSALVSDETHADLQLGSTSRKASPRAAWAAGASIGYIPLWFLGFRAAGGLQVGKQLTVGSSTWRLMRSALRRQRPPTTPTSPVTVEPRLRWYVVPAGPVKPYALTAASLRFYDGYGVEDNDAVNYPDRAGAWERLCRRRRTGLRRTGGLQPAGASTCSPASSSMKGRSRQPGTRGNATPAQVRAGIGFHWWSCG